MRIKSFIKLFALSCFLFVGTAQAQTDAKYSEQSLLKAWEDNQRAQPTTKLFQKTKDKNIYLFETTLFPYKGKIVVHNVLIHKDIEKNHTNYRAHNASELTGIIEAELIDAPKRFSETLHKSIAVWESQNTLFYFSAPKQWLTASQWTEEYNPDKILKEIVAPEENPKTKKDKSIIKFLLSTLPVLGVIAFGLFISRATKKLYETQTEKINLAIELQKEQTELLKQILAKKE